MGADLIIAYVKMKNNARWRRTSEKDRQKLMLERFSQMRVSPNELHEFYMFINGADPEELTERQRQTDMKNAIREFFECLNYRDVTWIKIGTYTLWLSGGMSWGDDPTDSYRTLSAFSALPKRLLEAGGFEW